MKHGEALEARSSATPSSLRKHMRTTWRAGLLAGLILPLVSCDSLGFHTWKWNQKVTLVIDTPNGPRTGSAVQEVVWYERPSWSKIGDSGGWFSNKLRGEAAVVEVAPDRYLFALLKTYDDPAANKVFRPARLRDQINPPDRRIEVREENNVIEASRETRDIPRSVFPTLVTFGRLDDPSSAQLVSVDNFERVFGRGYRIRSIQLAITTEDQTTGRVRQVLGADFFKQWTVQFKQVFKSIGPFGQFPFAFTLTRNDFIAEG